MYLKDFHLNNRMGREKYVMIKLSMISQEFAEKYNPAEKSHNGYIYTRVTKGMYGLPKEGRTSHDTLVKHLDPFGYHPSSITPRLWKHNIRPINFTMVVDDCDVKY